MNILIMRVLAIILLWVLTMYGPSQGAEWDDVSIVYIVKPFKFMMRHNLLYDVDLMK